MHVCIHATWQGGGGGGYLADDWKNVSMVAPLPGPSSKNTSSLSAGPVHEGGNPLPNGSNGDSKTKEKTALLEMSSRSGV